MNDTTTERRPWRMPDAAMPDAIHDGPITSKRELLWWIQHCMDHPGQHNMVALERRIEASDCRLWPDPGPTDGR